MKLPAVVQGDLEEARKALAMGKGLERAAYIIGVTPQDLDLMLWNRGGALRGGPSRAWRAEPKAWAPAPAWISGGELP